MRSSFKVVFLKIKRKEANSISKDRVGRDRCAWLDTMLDRHVLVFAVATRPLPLCDPNRQRDADRIACIQDDFLVTDALLDFSRR